MASKSLFQSIAGALAPSLISMLPAEDGKFHSLMNSLQMI